MNSCVDIEHKCGELGKLDQVAALVKRFDDIYIQTRHACDVDTSLGRGGARILPSATAAHLHKLVSLTVNSLPSAKDALVQTKLGHDDRYDHRHSLFRTYETYSIFEENYMRILTYFML